MTTTTTLLLGVALSPNARTHADLPVLSATVDGSTIEAVGVMLLLHYATRDRAIALLQQGHRTYVGPKVSDGLVGGEPTEYGSRDAFLDALAESEGRVGLLYEEGQWDVYDATGHRGRLDSVIA